MLSSIPIITSPISASPEFPSLAKVFLLPSTRDPVESVQVIEGAAKLWEQKPHLKELQSRVKLIGGDFFKPETIPAGRDGDVYVLRTIIHDC